MLASRAREAFDSPEHVFDLKWGGVRALAFVERARLRLVSQAGREITAWFPELASIAGQLRLVTAVLDGEIVALNADGEPELGLLASRLAGAPPDASLTCVYQAYDLLYEGGRSLLDLPLFRRRDELKTIVRATGPAVSGDGVDREGIACFEAVSARRLPGMVAREKASPYLPGRRTSAWQEVPVYESGWFVVGGYVLGVGREEAVAGLLLGEPAAGGRLRYAGMVQGGFPAGEFESALSALSAPVCPFAAAPSLARLVYWLRPELVCEVNYAQRESDGRLRFPRFVTLRPDLGPAQCAAPEQSATRAL